MIIHVDLSVKFRAFGITFGTLVQHWDLNLLQLIPELGPVASVILSVLPLSSTLVNFDQRGVALFIQARNPSPVVIAPTQPASLTP